MSRHLPADVVAIGEALAAEAGSYLFSTIREPRVTCTLCAAPVANYELCIPCSRHIQTGVPLADRVGSLVYGVEPDSQAYRLVRNYKAERPGPSHVDTMRALLALGLRGHHACAEKLSGQVESGWAVVPSTRGRTRLHELVASLSTRPGAEVPVVFVGQQGNRDLRPADWQIDTNRRMPNHLLLIDDSWVTGAHAQAVASALKYAGADQVSIFTVARVLDPAWTPTTEFIRQRFARPGFDWTRCPWTGGACP